MVTISFHIKFLYCVRTLDIFVYNLMKTVEIFRLDMFGLDAYLVQPEENKKSLNYETGKDGKRCLSVKIEMRFICAGKIENLKAGKLNISYFSNSEAG